MKNGAAMIVVGVLMGMGAVGFVLVDRAEAQWQQTGAAWCEEERGDWDQDRHCLVLEATFVDPGELTIDGGMNGRVEVVGWSRDEVEVRAKVWARARSVDRAEEIVDAIELKMERGRLGADGPDSGRRESWGVSWQVMVPYETDIDVETFNGGLSVTEVDGRLRFEALNGAVHLTHVSGDVQGRTTNGGLHIELEGDRWDGSGMNVQTTNGGVTIRVPEGYSADLEARTVNGGIDIDFPVTVRGRIGRSLSTELGDGGAMIRAVTTNGGVKIQRGPRAVRQR